MNVVHIIIGLNVGGAELMLKRLIESQHTHQEIHHSVISLTDSGVIGPQLSDLGISVYSLGMKSLMGGPLCFFRLRRLLKKLQPDIAHTWMYHADMIGGLAAYSLGIRNIIWCIRSTDIRKGGSRLTLLIREACAWLSYSIPKVIICAAQSSKQVHEEVGYDARKMLVLPNGFDLERLTASDVEAANLRRQHSIKDDELLIGSVGRYSLVKDHATFIEAAGLLAARNMKVRFLLVGRDLNADNNVLLEHIKATGYEERFILLCQRNDIPVCLKAMDLFCLHSKTEGFPNVLGEAMALKLPCVTTNVGDAAYLLGDGGEIIPASDPGALSRALERLVNLSVREREALGERNRSRISQNFTLPLVSNQYADIYLSMDRP